MGKKLLLVEDDNSLREIYSIRLTAEGYTIVSAENGEEALAIAAKEKPDLIISDVMMPKISGFDMLDILRSTPETKDIKIIMMTALSSEDQRQRGEALGADRYLVKSQVGIEDVVATVHEVLGDGADNNAQAKPEEPAVPQPPATPTPPAPKAPNPTPQPAPEQPPAPVATPEPAPAQPAPQPAPEQPPAPTPAAPQPASAPASEQPAAPAPQPAPAPTPETQPPVSPVSPAPDPAPAPQPAPEQPKQTPQPNEPTPAN